MYYCTAIVSCNMFMQSNVFVIVELVIATTPVLCLYWHMCMYGVQA